VRAAASESYFVPIITLVLGAEWLLLAAAEALERADAIGIASASAGAGLLASAAARIHPCAYLPLALAPLVVLAAPGSGVRRRVALLTLAVTVFGLAIALTSSSVVEYGISSALHHPVAPAVAFPVRGALVLLGLALALSLVRAKGPPSWLLVPGLLSTLALLLTRDAFAQHPLWQATYDRLWFSGIALALAGVLSDGVARQALLLAVTAAGIGFVTLKLDSFLASRTTEQLEYRFLKQELGHAPPGCVIAAVRRAGKRTVDIPDYVLPGSLVWDVHRAEDFDAAAQDGRCVVALQTSICSSPEARPLCEGLSHSQSFERTASAVLPAVPSYLGLPYDRPTVEVAVLRAHAAATSTSPETTRAAEPEGGCPVAITAERAKSLYERLVLLRESDGCKLENLDAEPHRVRLEFRLGAGPLLPLHLTPALCRHDEDRVVGSVALSHLAELGQHCALTLRAVERELSRQGELSARGQ
jgi:hypothetical protein